MKARQRSITMMITIAAGLLLSFGATYLLAYAIARSEGLDTSWSIVYQFIPRYYALLAPPLCALLVADFFQPTHDRHLGANDNIVSGLATASVIAFILKKPLGALLDNYLPYAPGTSFAKGSEIPIIIAATLAALAAPRFLNVRISRLAKKSHFAIPKTLTFNAVAIWAFVSVLSLDMLRDALGSSFPIIRHYPAYAADHTWLVLGLPLSLFALGWAFVHFSRDLSMNPIGRITEAVRNDYPVLSWTQTVSTNDTVASYDTKIRFKLYLGMIAVAIVAGIASGNPENLLFYLIAVIWLGSLGLRGAGKYALQGQTLVHVPHSKTEAERREELTPLTRREDCEAYIEKQDGKLWFCVARGTAGQGPLPVVERVPFDSFGNFEEGSHKQWFRPRGTVSETLDWGVIVAQSSVGRIVLVAQSLNEQAWLIELLVKLQTTFIGPRDAMLRTLKEAEQKRRAHDEPNGHQVTQIDEAPIKPF